MTPYSLINICQRRGGTYCRYLQGIRLNQAGETEMDRGTGTTGIGALRKPIGLRRMDL
jgi:hypothetical protein